jgi:hypothetical protein
MSIPRDPGYSSAFNVGIGLSESDGPVTFGLDAILEPIWSHTWADAAEPIESASGRMIPAGGMTIENRFRFSNALFRMGVDQELMRTASLHGKLQLGVGVRTIHYWLEQHDHVQLTDRDLEESWTEWMPTWGLSVGLPELEIRYRGSVTHGTGRPGVAAPRFMAGVNDLAVGSNILVAPSGPLSLDEVRVVTHQVSLSLPLR